MKDDQLGLGVGLIGVLFLIGGELDNAALRFTHVHVGILLIFIGYCLMEFMNDKKSKVPLKKRVRIQHGGRNFIAIVEIDPCTGRVSAPADSEERIVTPASSEDLEDPELLRAPYFKLEDPTSYTRMKMLGYWYEFRIIFKHVNTSVPA
jgi:hypothetical protein